MMKVVLYEMSCRYLKKICAGRANSCLTWSNDMKMPSLQHPNIQSSLFKSLCEYIIWERGWKWVVGRNRNVTWKLVRSVYETETRSLKSEDKVSC